MTAVKKDGTSRDPLIDRREQPYNRRETGSLVEMQLPEEAITTLHGIVCDIDLPLFRPDAPVLIGTTPKKFLAKTLGPMLERSPALAGAEVRDTGRNLHVNLWLDEPVQFQSDGDRCRWAGIVRVVQAALPIDPDQPGITALTRPIGSTNSKTGRRVKLLKAGTSVSVAEVMRLYDAIVAAPFRTIMSILMGGDRVSPCPICKAEGTALGALDRGGQCYGSCGKVKLESLYDAFFVPRERPGGEADDARR